MSVRGFFDKMFGKHAAAVVERTIDWPDTTANYRKQFYDISDFIVNELPPFTLWTARSMLYDPVVRVGLNTRNAILSAAEVTITSENNSVKEYVQKLHNIMWGRYGTIIRRTKHYGFQGIQVIYDRNSEDKRVYPCDVKTYSPYDVRCLTYRGKPVSFIVSSGGNLPKHRRVPILPPRGLWMTFNTEHNDYYGEAITRGAYPPWYEKWMKHGFKRTSQLRFMKDASRGDQISYPPRAQYKLPNGNRITAADVVREITENTLSGSTIRLPSTRDEMGNPEWVYAPPVELGNPTGIMSWGDSLNIDIWRGLDVFEEVIRAGGSGSGFSGRSVPFLMCLSSCNDEHIQYVDCLERFIYGPCVWHEFGPDATFSINCVPLAQTFVEDIAGSSVGGASMGGSHGDRAYPGNSDERTGMSGTKEVSPMDVSEGVNQGTAGKESAKKPARGTPGKSRRGPRKKP